MKKDQSKDRLVSETLAGHYEKLLGEYGADYRAVNYSSPDVQRICFQTVLEAIRDPEATRTLLDVGCGPGHLLDHILKHDLPIRYEGLDFSKKMVAEAQGKYPGNRFHCLSLFDLPEDQRYDFLVAVGLFTRKTSLLSTEDLSVFFKDTVLEMYRRCNCGIAFNMVTSYVEYTKEDLFHSNPGETLNFCKENLSRHVCLRHDYPLWDFTVYVYRPDYMKKIYNFYK